MRFEDINIGDVYSFERIISTQDVLDFARLTGDHNPLHLDPEFADKTEYKKNIVHGMLASSLFSTLVGMHCAGEHSLYLSQSVNFREPLFHNEKVLIKGTVTKKHDGICVVIMRTQILLDGKILVDGEARIKVLNYE